MQMFDIIFDPELASFTTFFLPSSQLQSFMLTNLTDAAVYRVCLIAEDLTTFRFVCVCACVSVCVYICV